MVTIFAIYRVLSVLSLWFLSFASHTPLLRWLVLPESDSLPPDIDPFYAFPANLSSYGEGQIIRSRPVAHGNFIRHVGSVVQVLYRTNNTQHEPSATVTTILKPEHVASSGPPRVISFQIWEDAASINCAPSYTLLRGLRAPNMFTYLLDTPLILNMAMSRGWYVVVPDHQGPRSAFMAGYEEGYATLDGVRAGLTYLGLPSHHGVGLIGYSGGGHATAWASHLSASYASDLTIVAAAYGGTPVDLNTMLSFLNTQPFSGFAAAGLAGNFAAYPEAKIEAEAAMDPEVFKAIDMVRSKDFCVLDVVAQHSRFDWMPLLYSPKFNQSIFEFGPLQEVIARETLLRNSSVGVTVPKFPRYIWQASDDEMVVPSAALQYAREQCEDGADIVEVTLFPGLEHLGAMLLGAPKAVHFLEKAFNGDLHSPRRPGPFLNGTAGECGRIVNYFSEPSLISSLPCLEEVSFGDEL